MESQIRLLSHIFPIWLTLSNIFYIETEHIQWENIASWNNSCYFMTNALIFSPSYVISHHTQFLLWFKYWQIPSIWHFSLQQSILKIVVLGLIKTTADPRQLLQFKKKREACCKAFPGQFWICLLWLTYIFRRDSVPYTLLILNKPFAITLKALVLSFPMIL